MFTRSPCTSGGPASGVLGTVLVFDNAWPLEYQQALGNAWSLECQQMGAGESDP
ncbi:hypothetical protein [Actinomyces minihominis]|uniref:hypothetical protein n=1 Tax=Actinomyces minihominis TaxID=2002838 RepID=UPI0013ED852E|nr:hypothetical protein [Actinomyces minihominis]